MMCRAAIQSFFDLDRAYEDGPVSAREVDSLDALRPHLARAAVLSARLAFEKAKAMTNALRSVGLAGAVLGKRGQLIVANDKFERLIGNVFHDHRERLALRNLVVDRLFADGLQKILSGSFAATLSIPIPAFEQQPLIVHVVPVCGVAHDIFSQATAVLYVTLVGGPEAPAADVLSALFDLTSAEAIVARELVAGHYLARIAGRSGRSRETVRSQLKSIFKKTGTRRQTELVCLLVARTSR